MRTVPDGGPEVKKVAAEMASAQSYEGGHGTLARSCSTLQCDEHPNFVVIKMAARFSSNPV